MATFEQFRASFPEDNDVKGKRFETFLCHWLLKEHPIYKNKFRKVWHFEDWPKRWGPRDIGTDLIAEDTEGKICAIQAKFYRAENYIPKGHVDSFLADSSRDIVDYRLLIATTDRLGINATNAIEGQAIPVQMFLLSDFLSSPLSWPNGSTSFKELKAREPHAPRPHQQAAIDEVSEKLNGRGQLIMACGTGKTLTGQRIAEKLEAKTTLVLLPSLLLLSKTVSDWLVEAKQDFRFLPVCSDKSVTKKVEDEIELSSSELGFGTTTDADEIASFLKRRGNKVIFSTYQSSPKIAEAFTKHSLKPFDLIIADEAHRCAGKSSADYSTVLDGELLPAKHRLFMTATPRTFRAHIKKKAKENDIEIASMDDETIFGPVLHHLTFGQAIANDPPLLTDYRVLVIGVNKDSVKEMVEERTLVRTEEGVEDDARSLAIQVGLAKAIRDYDLKRVITFHSKISLAKNFASSFNEFKDHLREDQRPSGSITYEHVSGKMPTSERSNKLRALGALEEEDRYLLANARCLSEGVDVPALDGVAFVDPKRSEIDIIQAVGRAIRLSDGKETGTIIIPVFLSDSDDPDEVISASEFDQVWKVVNALRSHDETLGEELDELRVQSAKKPKISLRGSRIVFDVHQKVGEEFVEAFETRLIEASTASWEFWYGLLEHFIELNGNCLVPDNYKINDLNLGKWVGKQRAGRDRLTTERIRRLDALNFVWDPLAERWEAGFAALQAFKEQHGHFRVPKGYDLKGFQLRQWAAIQRSTKNQMPYARRKRLDDLGFSWNLRDEQWEEGFAALRAFKKEHGHCDIPARLKFKNFNLGIWVGVQRSKKSQLSPEREQLLVGVGLVLDPLSEKWDKGFAALKAYREDHGHCLVPQKYKLNGYKLGHWVTTQRTISDEMPSERKKMLDDIGFVWDPSSDKWERGLLALEAFKARHGHCRVPGGYKLNGINLENFVLVQRRTRDEMPPDRRQRLDDLGLVWDPIYEQWEKGFAELQVFQKEHGHCRVPDKYKINDFNLGNWVGKQRAKRDRLSTEQIRRLDALNFVWDPLAERWEAGFAALQAFKEQHGHFRVPSGFKINGVNLQSFVAVQKRTRDQMPSERKQRLEELGFVWDVRLARSI